MATALATSPIENSIEDCSRTASSLEARPVVVFTTAILLDPD
jgi:hypothetical protein